MIEQFALFAGVGFLAQLVDGALGMAYGVVSSTVLLSFGVLPAQASASVHAAELFTTAASGGSHIANKNIDWRLFWRLAPAGIVGGVLGAYVLTSIDGAMLRPFVIGYLGIMGVVILARGLRKNGIEAKPVGPARAVGLGGLGGFMDAVGGGGWGPIVTTALVGSGSQPRFAIGTVNTAEFLVTVAVSATFVVALVTGHWADADGLMENATAVAGLIAGGVVAAPLAGTIIKHLPVRVLTLLVGTLVLTLAVYQLARLMKWI